jgi:hypothetical protein
MVHSTPLKTASGIQHVVILAIDGLRADQLYQFISPGPSNQPFLAKALGVEKDKDGKIVFRKALRSEKGTTVFPSYTFPAWTSFATGLYPGAHGITGNQIFFRKSPERASSFDDDSYIPEARYYTEHHLDAVWVYWSALLNRDIYKTVPTLYEVVSEAGGQSLVVHHMVSRGVGTGNGDWRWPTKSTLELYLNHEVERYDERSLHEFILAVRDLNKGGMPRQLEDIFLPTITTIYFPGLDHRMHITAPPIDGDSHQGYLNHISSILKGLFEGTVIQDRDGKDVIWPGLSNFDKLKNNTVYVILSDHGHTPIASGKALSNRTIEILLAKSSPNLKVHKTDLSFLAKGSHRISYSGDPSEDENAFVTINGGSAGIYLKNPEGGWSSLPLDAHVYDVARNLSQFIDNGKIDDVQAMFVRQGAAYFECRLIKGLRDINGNQLPRSTSAFSCENLNPATGYGPNWHQRIQGLIRPEDSQNPFSAPDIILLANRNRYITFANDQHPWTSESEDSPGIPKLHSDHGHLSDFDSEVPIVFFGPRFAKLETPLTLLPPMNIVDVAPTVLDMLGLYNNYCQKVQKANIDNSYIGVSYYPQMAALLGNKKSCSQVGPSVQDLPAPTHGSFNSWSLSNALPSMPEKSIFRLASSDVPLSYSLHAEIRPVTKRRETKEWTHIFSTFNQNCDGDRDIVSPYTITEPDWKLVAWKITNEKSACSSGVVGIERVGDNAIKVLGRLQQCPLKPALFMKACEPTKLEYTLDLVGERYVDKPLQTSMHDIRIDFLPQKTISFTVNYPYDLPKDISESEVKWEYNVKISIIGVRNERTIELSEDNPNAGRIETQIENRKLIVKIAPTF